MPITLQTFAVLLSGAVLGMRRGFLAVLLYVVAGAAGLPIFSGGAAGLAVLTGPTAGYLIGFPLAAGLCGCDRRAAPPPLARQPASRSSAPAWSARRSASTPSAWPAWSCAPT